MSSRVAPLALLGLLSACGGAASPAAPLPKAQPAPRAASSATKPAAEPSFEKMNEDAERKTTAGATLVVPKGWFLKAGAGVYTLEEPDRDFSMSLVEVEAETNEAAIAKAWERLGRKAPAKIADTWNKKDSLGWDEILETTYELEDALRASFVNTRRKGHRTWAFVIEGKKSAFGRRSAQLGQVIGGLKAFGVEPENLSKNAAATLDGERAEAFETFIASARAKTQVPGVAVAVVQDGKIVFEKGFGTKAVGKKEPVTERTRFLIGSVTKSLSTLLIAKLVDEGKLKWETPVKELLPSFETGDPTFTSNLRLWHTFCACTGMPRHDLELVFEYGKTKPESAFTWFSAMKPTTSFGETFQYSNQMTALGGFLAARVAVPNKPLSVAYETAMKTRLFDPMGMTDTTASFEEGHKGGPASPHSETLLGTYGAPIALPPNVETFITPIGPAGGVISTAHDMARYALVELAQGKTPEGKVIVSSANMLERRKPRVKASDKASYGLGLAITEARGLDVVTHDGGTFGFISRFQLVPSKNVGFVILTNQNSMGDELTRAITQRFYEIVFGAKERADDDLAHALEQGKDAFKKQQDKLTSQETPEAVASKLVGTWHADRLGSIVISLDPKRPKTLRADVGEWSSRLGYVKGADGSERVFFLDPPVAGIGARVDDKELVIEFAQDVFHLNKTR